MGAQRARYEKWLQNRRGRRWPEHEPRLLMVADAVDAANESGVLSPENLRTVVEAASSPHAFLWMNAVELLMPMGERWRDAAEAILEMSKNSKSHVRFSAICALGKNSPEDVAETVLRNGLKDKSAKVRWKAADQLECLGKRRLLQELTTALEVERNPKARRTIEHCFLMLRDGYILRPESNGENTLWVRHSRGFVGESVTSQELEERGIDAIALERREQHERRFPLIQPPSPAD